DQPGQVSFSLKLDSPHPGSRLKSISSDTLALTGQVRDDGLRFEARLRVLAAGGRVACDDEGISVDHADSVTLLLVAATSFRNFQDISADPAERCAVAQSVLG